MSCSKADLVLLKTLAVYSPPKRRQGQKLRNIESNPRIDLNLSSNARGGDAVRVEGLPEVVEGAPPLTEVPGYMEKYWDAIARIGFDLEGFARTYSVAIRITPTRWQAW